MLHAIEVKLINQRNFVLWWDKQDKQKNQWDAGDRSVTSNIEKLDTYHLDRKTVSRWRQRLADPDKSEKYLNTTAVKAWTKRR